MQGYFWSSINFTLELLKSIRWIKCCDLTCVVIRHYITAPNQTQQSTISSNLIHRNQISGYVNITRNVAKHEPIRSVVLFCVSIQYYGDIVYWEGVLAIWKSMSKILVTRGCFWLFWNQHQMFYNLRLNTYRNINAYTSSLLEIKLMLHKKL